MHPLAPDLSKLTDEELHTKRGEIQSRMSYAYKIGNADMVGQLQLLSQDYALEVERRNQKMLEQTQKSGRSPDPETPMDITR